MEIRLTEHQNSAFQQIEGFALGKNGGVMTLEGYAGTGKTTLVGELIKKHAAQIGSIAVAAPTNKAVKVLREKMGDLFNVEFGSIHSFLGLRMQELEDGQQTCRKEGESSLGEFNLAIVDECSMISRELFKYILTSQGRCRVLFVGDPAQLPPVGDLEMSPVFALVENKTALTQVVRQAEGNPIIRLSMKVRECIVQNQPADPHIIAESLPSPGSGTTACLVNGGFETAVAWALSEQRDGRDARIIAYTNAQVQRYNQVMHDSIYGHMADKFCVGEKVIAHQAFDAKDAFTEQPVSIHTSEELKVLAIDEQAHPKYPDIPASRLTLERDGGTSVECYIAKDQRVVDQKVSEYFAKWREYKDGAEKLQLSGERSAAEIAKGMAKDSSGRAWALRKAFAPLRHAYALTAHKSQGSTFDTALVDYADLCRMRSTFDFNRALYVSITRPRSYLAVVI